MLVLSAAHFFLLASVSVLKRGDRLFFFVPRGYNACFSRKHVWCVRVCICDALVLFFSKFRFYILILCTFNKYALTCVYLRLHVHLTVGVWGDCNVCTCCFLFIALLIFQQLDDEEAIHRRLVELNVQEQCVKVRMGRWGAKGPEGKGSCQRQSTVKAVPHFFFCNGRCCRKKSPCSRGCVVNGL